LGVIPANTKLTPRPKEIPAWDSLSPDERRVAARLMEVFAAYTAQTDYEVGRMLDALQEIGQLNNTLIFWEIGDNGASMEGTLSGAFNELATLQGIPEDTAFLLAHIDELGSAKASNHIPVGWAWAVNTPFQWGKQVASHFGGTRNPLVIAWPDRIKDAGGVRTQFHHVIDISPTILEAARQPGAVGTLWTNAPLAQTYAAMGRYREAADTILAIQGSAFLSRPVIEQAAGMLRQAPGKLAAPQSAPFLDEWLSWIYLYVGAPERALEGEERRVQIGLIDFFYNVWFPEYAPVRKTERFKALMRSTGIVDYWRARGWPDLCHPAGADDFACN